MVRIAVLRAACVVFAVTGGSGNGADSLVVALPPTTRDLDAYQWSHRPVLIFAPSRENSAYQQQLAALRVAQDGLAERDIVVLTDTDPGAAGMLREGLGIKGFVVLLVGKDGGVKLRRGTPLGVDEIFAAIDAMPMRQQEMRRD